MLIPFLKLELCILIDEDDKELGMHVEFSQGLMADPKVYEQYRKVLNLAVQAMLEEVENAKRE